MATASLRPFFALYGGKWRIARHYPLPRFDTIVEPFAGSAGYSLRYPDRAVVLIEKDPIIAATWRYLMEVSADEILGLPDISVGQSVDDLDVSDGARLLIGWWLNRGTTTPCKSLSSWAARMIVDGHTYGGKIAPTQALFWNAAVRRRISAQVEHIRHWKLIEGDYSDAPDVYATWFVDPPYQRVSRTYRFGRADIDYSVLSAACRRMCGQVIVCEQEGADWLPFRPFMHAKANESASGGKVSREAIWVMG